MGNVFISGYQIKQKTVGEDASETQKGQLVVELTFYSKSLSVEKYTEFLNHFRDFLFAEYGSAQPKL